jgi:ABC-2 type transport system ATP-binding protein
MSVLAFTDVHRAYRRGHDVLTGVSFDLAPGEVVGLLGQNGAGKTTLMRLALGMLEPQAGEVRVFGRDPRRDPVAVKRRIGYVAEDQVLPDFLRVREAIALHRNLYPAWDERLAGELAGRFALDPEQKLGELSKGQARQVALLCAVSHRPELLLLDEPAGGLDPAVRRRFLEAAIELLAAGGTTILFSSHYMGDVERLASRLVMIHRGEKWIDSALDDVREGYSLALVPSGKGVSTADLLRIPSCLCARERVDAIRAVFELEPGACAQALSRELGVAGGRCVAIGLEDMFIELVGDAP